MKGSCVTGHRDIPVELIDSVKERLRNEVELAINDGYTHFISGYAKGVDLMFAEIVIEFKASNPAITLEAAIPYRSRLNTPDLKFQKLMKICDKETIVSEKYSHDCYMLRNLYMVENSGRVIGVYDGRDNGGTAFTLRNARLHNREIRIIPVL